MEVNRNVYREDHEQFRTSVRRFMERECVPRQEQWNEAGEVDRETWLKAGREGLLCTTLPVEYGGGGGDFGHAAVIAEELARAGVGGLSIGLHSDIVAPYVNRLGTEEQKQKLAAGHLQRQDDPRRGDDRAGRRQRPEGDPHDGRARR